MSVYTQYTDEVFTKPKFLEGIRTMAEGMLLNLPEELKEDLKADFGEGDPEKLLTLILDEYAVEFFAFRDAHEEVIKELYTEEQVQILLDIQAHHPWIREKAIEQLKLTFEKDQEHSQRIAEKVHQVIDDFFEKDDRKITGPMEF